MNLGACKIKIVLFSTVGCHLCERAEALLRRHADIALKLVEIVDDPVLLERYEMCIRDRSRSAGQTAGKKGANLA